METIEQVNTQSSATEQTQSNYAGSEQKVFDTQAVDTSVATPSSWLWADGVEGNGDKPEFFKDGKYKSVAEQAKAYTELEKRFGGFVGAPQEGYQLAEELGVASDDPSINAVLDILKESNASNDFANKLIGTYVEAQQAQAQAQIAKELELLGSNADYRINAIKEFAGVNLPSELQDTFQSMVTTAKGVEVIEALMKKMQGSAVAPQSTERTPAMDAGKLREMMFAKNENGQLLSSIDPEYKRKVDKAYAQFYGA